MSAPGTNRFGKAPAGKQGHWLIAYLLLLLLPAGCRRYPPLPLQAAATTQPATSSISPAAKPLPSPVFPPDWAAWRGPGGTNISPEQDWTPEALRNGAQVLWQKNVGRGYATVAVAQYRLYAVGNRDRRDTLYCLDATTGAELRTFSYPALPGYWQGPRATPVVEGDHVYLVSRYGLVSCLERRSGHPYFAAIGRVNTQRDVFNLLLPGMVVLSAVRVFLQ